MPDKKSLTVSLAEFGLSKYEAEAYVALLSGGTMSASELAYLANISRTKVYPVLMRLEKKRLATVTRGRHVTCAAVPPQESFDEAIGAQISKVNAMNSLVEDLKAVGENAKRTRTATELKYAHITHSGVLVRAQELMRSASSTIHASTDASGVDLLSECGGILADASKNGIKTMIMVPASAVGTDELRNISHGALVRISELEHNCIIVDDAHVMIVGGDAGRAAVFESSAILAGEQEYIFASMWARAMPAEAFTSMPRTAAREAYRAAKLVCAQRSDGAPVQIPDDPGALISLLAENGVRLRGRGLDYVIALADAGMRATCSGSVSYDTTTGKILVESNLSNARLLSWVHMLEGYLADSGIKTRFVHQKRARQGEQIHIMMGRAPASTAKRGAPRPTQKTRPRMRLRNI